MLAARPSRAAAGGRLEFRIGINLGDVMVEGDDLFGDGVNVAARLQALAEPGGIYVSGGIYDQIKGKLPFGADFRASRRSRTSRTRSGSIGCARTAPRSDVASSRPWRTWLAIAADSACS